jgi:hypothetical protein
VNCARCMKPIIQVVNPHSATRELMWVHADTESWRCVSSEGRYLGAAVAVVREAF